MSKKEKLEKQFKALQSSWRQVIASYDEGSKERMAIEDMYGYMDAFASNMYREMSEIYSYIHSLEGKMYKHEEGHIPQLTAGQMSKLLEAAGASEDYAVQKKPIWVANFNENQSEIRIK